MLTTLVVGLVIFGTLPSCERHYRNKSHAEVSDESIVRGRKLAEKHCQSCHMLPDPSLLDAKSWENGVMPQMGPQLGIFEYLFKQYPSEAYNRNLDKNYYPSKARVSLDEWQDLINYYIATSPDTLAVQKRDRVLNKTLPFFNIKIPSIPYNSPATGLVKVDPFGVTPILKPYHGVYIFINNGDNRFHQEYFFPVNGCYKAIARDYDEDGDIDIATISFFPDFKTSPEESFIYLENRGGYNFLPYSFTEAVLGRWLTMDAGDIDRDGKIDLILGNFSIAPNPTINKINYQKGPPFIVLKNISK